MGTSGGNVPLVPIDRALNDLSVVRAVVRDNDMFGDATQALSRIEWRLHIASCAFSWIAENYPRAIREMPAEIVEQLRRA